MARIKIRAATIDDLPFLREMLAEASNREFGPPFEKPVAHPRHRRYVEGWGRPGDTGLIAEGDGERLGAAWYRLFSEDEPGTGSIDQSRKWRSRSPRNVEARESDRLS